MASSPFAIYNILKYCLGEDNNIRSLQSQLENNYKICFCVSYFFWYMKFLTCINEPVRVIKA